MISVNGALIPKEIDTEGRDEFEKTVEFPDASEIGIVWQPFTKYQSGSGDTEKSELFSRPAVKVVGFERIGDRVGKSVAERMGIRVGMEAMLVNDNMVSSSKDIVKRLARLRREKAVVTFRGKNVIRKRFGALEMAEVSQGVKG